MKTPARSAHPGVAALALLAGIALAHGAWALWLWLKLVDARRGGAVTCALGGSRCTEIWDSPFANAVQTWTLLPVAAWGVVWSAVAAAMPLLALRTRARGPRQDPYWLAVLAAAALGLIAIAGLAAVMLRSRALCTDCLLSYGLVLAYAALAFGAGALPAGPRVGRAGTALLLAGLAAYLVALYPASRTPGPPAQAALASLRKLELPPGGSSADRMLADLLRGLDAEELQRLSDELAVTRSAPAVPTRPARALIGSRTAPVRLTEFHDLQCPHCADLHSALGLLRQRLPPDSFALETRNFPLDSSCNPHIQGPSQSPVRCTAAKLMICSESQPWAFELAGRIFQAQERLDQDLLYELASPWAARADLEACVRSEATEAHLRDDLDWAAANDIQGTPMVLINGRKTSPWPVLLMAEVLSRGRADHPLLAHLPPPHLR
jgi:serine/threonine-protein kinase